MNGPAPGKRRRKRTGPVGAGDAGAAREAKPAAPARAKRAAPPKAPQPRADDPAGQQAAEPVAVVPAPPALPAMPEPARPEPVRAARAPGLRSWEPRRGAGAADAAAWSRAVRILKYALPSAALALIVGVFAFTSGTVPATPFSIAVGDGGTLTLDPSLSQTRLTTHVDGRPLSVTARNAVQIEGDPQRWRLHTIEGRLGIEGGGTVSLAATAADVDGRAQSATLSGGIVITESGGYRLETNTAAADLRAGRLWSNSPVRGEGPVGSIEAGAFELFRDGRVSFTGGVRTVFTPKPDDAAGPGGAAAATPAPAKAAEAAATPQKETEPQ